MINADGSRDAARVCVSAAAAALAAEHSAADALHGAAKAFRPGPIDPRISATTAYRTAIADFRTYLSGLADQLDGGHACPADERTSQ